MAREFNCISDCFGFADLFNRNLWRMCLAELIGTFLVVFIGLLCKVTIIEKFTPTIERQGLGWGFCVASMMLVINHVGGGHLNPVVSFGLIFSGASSIIRSLLYFVMQIGAGLLAGMLFKYCMPELHVGEYAVLWHNHAVEPLYGFFVEMGATVPLLLLFASLKDQNRVDFRGSGALAVGMYHVAAHQCFWYYTGACLNPVRALAPAFATETWDHHWVYWAGPFAGAAIGGIVYPLLFRVKKELLEEQRNRLIERQKNLCAPDNRPPRPKPEPKQKPQKAAKEVVMPVEEEEVGRKRKKKGAEEEPPPEEDEGKKKKKKKGEEPPPPPPEEETGKKKKKKKGED